MYSMLFTILEQVCAVIDMILVGNFVSATAFSALNLVIPIESLMTGLVMLFTGGAGIIASRLIGDQNFNGAYRTLTVACMSSLAMAAFFSISGLLLMDDIVTWLSPVPALFSYIRDYLGIYFAGLIPIAMYSVVMLIVNIDGKPDVVFVTVIISCILDIVFDIVFMKVLDLQVVGLALATVMSYVIPVLVLFPYLASRKCSFKFVFSTRGSLGILRDNLSMGLPYSLPYIATCLITLVVNTVVISSLGPYALYIWGAGYQMLSLTIVAMNCIGGTILVIMGSMLVGCHDMDGFHFLVKSCVRMSAVVVGVITLVILIFPRAFLSVFGYDLPDTDNRATYWLYWIVLFAIPYAICCIRVYVSQALDRKLLSVLPLVALFGFTIASLYILSDVSPEILFAAFPVSGVAFFMVDLLAVHFIGRMESYNSRFYLIPASDGLKSKCLSVPYTQEGLNGALVELSAFLDECGIGPAVGVSVNLCCEELMLSVVQNNADKGEGYFFDVFVLNDEEEVKITVKDAGSPFNPVRVYRKTAAEALASGEDMDLSLRLLNTMCKELTYNYMYGQNTIYMSFRKNQVS